MPGLTEIQSFTISLEIADNAFQGLPTPAPGSLQFRDG